MGNELAKIIHFEVMFWIILVFEIITSHDFVNNINDYNRVSKNGATCIDLEVKSPGLLNYLLQTLLFNITVHIPEYYYLRNFCEKNLNNLMNSLNTIDWNFVHGEHSINDKWDISVNILVSKFQLHLPLQKKK